MGDLAQGLAVGRARHRDADRARGAVAGQPDDPHVVAEVLAAELGADAELLGLGEDLGLELDVAEAVAGGVPGSAACRGSGSRASLAVSTANSADVPPMTTARWYGGQAAVPRSAASRRGTSSGSPG